MIQAHLCQHPYNDLLHLLDLGHHGTKMTRHCLPVNHPPQIDLYQPAIQYVYYPHRYLQNYSRMNHTKLELNCIYTSWFDGDVKVPVPSEPNTIKGLDEPALCCNDGIEITSPGVCVDGVEGAELGEGPAVFAVPELLAGPEDDTGCFRLRPF